MHGRFALYIRGDVQFVDSRVRKPITFAHITDLHLPPCSANDWPDEYRSAINWWNLENGRPLKTVVTLLDEVSEAGVDFVFFGGDVLDFYDPSAADYVVSLCRERGLRCHFQLGNHDWETPRIRYVTHEFEADLRANRAEKLARHWSMPATFYSFSHGGVRFISLDAPCVGNDAVFDEKQVNWLIGELDRAEPTVVFCHVPFLLPTFEYRMRALLRGGRSCVQEDALGRRVRSAIERSQNLLGVFAGHLHIRSEDPIGQSTQFMTAPGFLRQWRCVTISDSLPPKSKRVNGEPI